MDQALHSLYQMVQDRYVSILRGEAAKVTRDNCMAEVGLNYRTWLDLVSVYRNCAVPFGRPLTTFAHDGWVGSMSKLKTLAGKVPLDPDIKVWYFFERLHEEGTLGDAVAVVKLCTDLATDLEALLEKFDFLTLLAVVRNPKQDCMVPMRVGPMQRILSYLFLGVSH